MNGDQMTIPNTIAIDGPAASGKSTLGKLLADTLGFLFFDTGVMYRAITWVAYLSSVPYENEPEITALAEETNIDVRPATQKDGRPYDVLANGEDITWQIRFPEVDFNVSLVSSYSGVRKALTKLQRGIGLRGNVVMVGRDIGTVVLPDAALKIYLDASVEQRALRRYNELIIRSEDAVYAEILSAMRERDRFDSNRDIAPLKVAGDAVIICSDDMDIDQVLEKAVELAQDYIPVKARSSERSESNEHNKAQKTD
jgi:cytidylate kinase